MSELPSKQNIQKPLRRQESANKFKGIGETTSAQEWFKYLLSDRNVSAFKIQSFWRERRTRKQYIALKRKKAYEIKVYTTSLAIDISQHTDQERIKYILDAMKLRHKWFDLNMPEVKTPELLKEIEQYGGAGNMPIVIINGFYIGGIQELQNLVDDGLLMPIIEKQYEDQCLYCQVTRESLEDNVCKFCWNKYMAFVKRFDESFKDLFANYDMDQASYAQSNSRVNNAMGSSEKMNRSQDMQNELKKVQSTININHQNERSDEKKQRSSSSHYGVGRRGKRPRRQGGVGEIGSPQKFE